MNSNQGPGGHSEPTNKAGRATFAKMTEQQQDKVRELAGRLYDGTRTVSQCWAEALRQTP